MRYSSVAHEAFASMRRVGLRRTVQLAVARVYDLAFDQRWGVDTAKRAELDDLEIDAETVGRGQMYQPTGVLPFRQVLDKVAFPKPGVFVDYGCGKGRTLLLASRLPFERVVGIEFSQELCEAAQRNADAFDKAGQLKAPIEIVCTDAVLYNYQGDENIFYFFYPFDADLMIRVLDSIDTSLQAHPRDAVLVYYYPIHRETLDERASFSLEQTFELYGYDCLVYRHLRESA
jgi:SAM-dependent methyltransferase